MGQKQSIAKQSDVEGITFDGTAFMEKISNSVDAHRSDVKSSPNRLVKTAVDLPSGERVESRLNCFYRLLGLPSTRDLSAFTYDSSEGDLKFINQHDTVNFFNPSDFVETFVGNTDPRGIGNTISRREGDFSKNKTVEEFIEMITNPLPVESLAQDSSILGSLPDGTVSVRKPSIFPMIVDAATPVFPLIKRTAPLFYDGDFIISGTTDARLPRTFIESVIYMRTQRFVPNMEEQISNITANTKVFVQNLNANQDLTAEEQVEQDALLKSLGVSNDQTDYNLVETQTINRLVQAISASSKNYRKIVDHAKKLNGEVSFKPAPKDTAKEKSGNTSQVIIGGETGQSEELRISALNAQIERSNLILTLLPTNQVLQADTLRRIANPTSGSVGITPDVFISEFTEVMALDTTSVKKQLREAENTRKKKLREFEILKSKIMYYSGEAQSLSIFDVLCIFLALFTIDLADLIGLLNSDARLRMEENKFFQEQKEDLADGVSSVLKNDNRFNSAIVADPVKVDVALGNLQEKVKENFNLAAAFFNDTRAGQNRKR